MNNTTLLTATNLLAHIPTLPPLATILAIREDDDTMLDAVSLAHALRVALHALDLAFDPEHADRETAYEALQLAEAQLGGTGYAPGFSRAYPATAEVTK